MSLQKFLDDFPRYIVGNIEAWIDMKNEDEDPVNDVEMIHVKCRGAYSGGVICDADIQYLFKSMKEGYDEIEWPDEMTQFQPFDITEREAYDNLGKMIQNIQLMDDHNLIRRIFAEVGDKGIGVNVFGKWVRFENKRERLEVERNFQ